MLSSRRPSRRLSWQTGFAGANRRRPATPFSMPLFPLVRLAQLFLRHAVLTRLAPITTNQTLIGRDRGPRAAGVGAAHQPGFSRSTCAGTAAVRTALPAPVASSSSPVGAPSLEMRTPTRSSSVPEGVGWTPPRPTTGVSGANARLHPGQSSWVAVRTRARVSTGCAQGGAALAGP